MEFKRVVFGRPYVETVQVNRALSHGTLTILLSAWPAQKFKDPGHELAQECTFNTTVFCCSTTINSMVCPPSIVNWVVWCSIYNILILALAFSFVWLNRTRTNSRWLCNQSTHATVGHGKQANSTVVLVVLQNLIAMGYSSLIYRTVFHIARIKKMTTKNTPIYSILNSVILEQVKISPAYLNYFNSWRKVYKKRCNGNFINVYLLLWIIC